MAKQFLRRTALTVERRINGPPNLHIHNNLRTLSMANKYQLSNPQTIQPLPHIFHHPRTHFSSTTTSDSQSQEGEEGDEKSSDLQIEHKQLDQKTINEILSKVPEGSHNFLLFLRFIFCEIAQ